MGSSPTLRSSGSVGRGCAVAGAVSVLPAQPRLVSWTICVLMQSADLLLHFTIITST